jgi:hypothetical protein
VLFRFAVTLACLLAAGVAAADHARVRWRGVVVEGRAPTALQPAVAAHIAVALRSLGSTVVTTGSGDAEAAASCAFPSTAKIARCVVVVQVGRAKGGRAERRAEIRYRDAEDLAESLALLVSDILTSEFPDIVGGHPETQQPPLTPTQPPAPTPTPTPAQPPTQAKPPTQTPTPTPTPLPTPEQQQAHEAEMQRQLEIVKSLQKQADDARLERDRQKPSPPPPKLPRLPAPTRLALEAGAVGVFGLAPSNPALVGGNVRALYSRALLRAGASLSVAGMREMLSGYDLTFIRMLVAARAGIGVRSDIADFDLTAGPALLILVEDAHTDGRHAVASVAFVGGPRLALTLAAPVALVVGADFDVALTDEKVVAGTSRVAQFSRASVEVTVGIAWRSRR